MCFHFEFGGRLLQAGVRDRDVPIYRHHFLMQGDSYHDVPDEQRRPRGNFEYPEVLYLPLYGDVPGAGELCHFATRLERIPP